MSLGFKNISDNISSSSILLLPSKAILLIIGFSTTFINKELFLKSKLISENNSVANKSLNIAFKSSSLISLSFLISR